MSGAPRDVRPLEPWILGLLIALHLLISASFLRYGDLSFAYPFASGDAFAWLSDGMALAGEPVRYTARPPLLPLALATLHRFGALHWAPLLGPILVAALAGLVYWGLVRSRGGMGRRSRRRVAFWVAVAVLLNASLQLLSLNVMADLAATTGLMAAVLAFFGAARRPRLYLLAGLCGGLSALTQQAAFLLPLPVGLTLLIFRRDHLRLPVFWAGGAFFALPVALWFGAKKIHLGFFGDGVTRQWGLLHPDLESLDFYLRAALSFVGWPALLLILWGAYLALRRVRRDAESFFLLTLATTVALFFGVVYDFEAKRFLLYLLPAGVFFLARGLEALPRTPGKVAVAAVLVASAFPLPGDEATTRFPLWPVPAVFADPQPGGGLSLRLYPIRGVLAASPYARLGRAWRDRQELRSLPAGAFAEDHSVVFLIAPDASSERRYDVQYRLGLALRKRVKVVPRTLYPATWWGWEHALELPGSERFRLWRLSLPGLEGSRLLATDRSASWDSALTRPRPAPGAFDSELALARRLDSAVRSRDGFLAIVGDGQREWQRLLPLITRTSSLFVLDPGGLEGLRAELAEAPRLGGFEDSGLEVVRGSVSGWRTVVALPGGGA